MKKVYIEKRLSLEKDKIVDILRRLGYTQEKGDFFKRTPRGRLHIKLYSINRNSCKMKVHHDLIAQGHYTLSFDATPHKAWKQIENELFSIYGTSKEKLCLR